MQTQASESKTALPRSIRPSWSHRDEDKVKVLRFSDAEHTPHGLWLFIRAFWPFLGQYWDPQDTPITDSEINKAAFPSLVGISHICNL
jgi:hypothetical protein